MPVMDGYTAARTLRDHGMELPIIAFTASTMKHDILRCLAAGCSTHFPKPFSRQGLFELLHHHLAKEAPPESRSIA